MDSAIKTLATVILPSPAHVGGGGGEGGHSVSFAVRMMEKRALSDYLIYFWWLPVSISC
jgi:hypothetical protein